MSTSAIVLVGRILLSVIFILAGYGKITNLSGTAGYFAGTGLPVPMVTAVVVSLVELVGGIFILVGFFTRRRPMFSPPSASPRRSSRISTLPTWARRSISRRTSRWRAASSCSQPSAPAPFLWTHAAPDRVSFAQ